MQLFQWVSGYMRTELQEGSKLKMSADGFV